MIIIAFGNSDSNEEIQKQLRKMILDSMSWRDFEFDLEVTDDFFFPGPRGHMKRVKLSMQNRSSLSVDFCILRRNIMKSLRDICLDVVAEEVEDGMGINSLEIPLTLVASLRRSWVAKAFNRNSINMLPQNEAMKRQAEFEKEKMRSQKPALTLHRIRA